MEFNWTRESLDYHGRKVLTLLGDLLKEERFQNRKKVKSSKNEVVTEADMAAEELVINYIKQNNISVNLDGEEKRRTTLTDAPEGLWALDPLDGTYNFYRGISDYCAILSQFESPEPKNLGSAVWAGILNHSNGKLITTNDKLKTSKRKTLEGSVGDAEASVMLDLGPKQKWEAYKPYSEIIESS